MMKNRIYILIASLLLVPSLTYGWTVYGSGSAATQTTNGLMSAADKAKLDTIPETDFTDWTAYTPVVTSESGGWTNYTATGRYRIVDRMLTVSFRVIFSTTSAAASGLYVSLPSGLTMNAAVMTGGASWDTDLVGFGILGDSGTISGVPAIIYTRTTQKVLVKYYNTVAASYLTSVQLSATAPWTWTWQDTVDGQFTAPIL